MSGSLNLIWKGCVRACRNLWHFPELPETLNIFDPFPRIFMLTESLFHHLSTVSLECIKNIFWDWVHEEDDTYSHILWWDIQAREQSVFEENNEKWFSCGYLLQHEPCSLIWSMSNRALQLFLKWQNKEERATLHGHEGFWNGKESGISQASVLAEVKELCGRARPLLLAVTYWLVIKLVPKLKKKRLIKVEF